LSSEQIVPDGSSYVLDTNTLLYANQGASALAVDILRRCAALEIIGYVPATVWEELCQRLMVIEAVATGRKPVRILHGNSLNGPKSCTNCGNTGTCSPGSRP
jgi:hypothetical protein